MKTHAERQRAMRDRMRKAGFVLRQLWVHPLDWPAVKAYVEAKRKARAASSASLAFKDSKRSRAVNKAGK